MLQYYKLEKKTEGIIYLEDGEQMGVGISVSGGKVAIEEEKDLLSHIIEKLNAKYGTNFSNSEKLAVEQISTNLKANKDLEVKAKVNSYDVFKHAFEPTFLEGVIQEYDKNQDFYGRILKDEDFRNKLMDLIMLDIYSSFKDTQNTIIYGS